MNAFTNLKIAYKIAALMLMLGAVTLALVLNGVTSIRSVDRSYSQLTDVTLPNNVELARAYQGTIDMTLAGYHVMAYPGGSAEGKAAVAREKQVYDETQKRLRDMAAAEPETKATIDGITAQIDGLHRTVGEAMAFGSVNRNEEARLKLAEADALALKIRADLRQFTRDRAEKATADAHALTASTNTTVTTMLLVGLLGLAVAVGLGIFIARRTIIAPLLGVEGAMRTLAGGNNNVAVEGTDRRDEVGAMAQAVLVFRDAAQEQERAQVAKAAADAEQQQVIDTVSAHLEALAQGDLSRPINAQFTGPYVALKDNFNNAITSLRDLIVSVTESVRSISSGSTEIQAASEDLARRTESAAASLEETSAAIAQINDRLRTGAESASRTVGRADQAMATVGTGRGTAEEAVSAMGRVADSAKGIDSVIEGLDKIAFQTRVLAMNAAVEAGRAGEAGRGFAVVADLVGQLAMRSEEEAKRAREQLTTTQNDVEIAVGAVERVDGALVGISADVTAVHELLSAMAQDNQAQAAAIQQIASAIGTMDESTQQNAAMVEETSAAARSLNSEVRLLGDRAATFRTGSEGPARAIPAAPVPMPAKPKAAAPAPAKPKPQPQPKPALKAAAGGNAGAMYQSPIKPLPAAAIPALVRRNDDWDEF
ncbi:methyl-accepting chemotaxis protein [Sphingomonas sp. BE123]|uniref:methyl-accepting chemotaxis protein n=1 Tax=Sphingomonas sp. BE123 TaxID=2817842 RepID=UPI0028642445|nr:methyl-accepting chemotaxis protein [Sphingomonas sp. BE123]MDR6853502.1 methyl-accepting chemotaxis protein [Sphingomonas sp. BE123]